MKKTPRETRENLIMDWHEKKLNRDELLRVLEGCEEIDKPTKDKMEHEIIKNFYENFEAAKHNTEYELANNLNLEIKKNKKLLQKKGEELDKMWAETTDLRKIEEGMVYIAGLAMDLEDGSWWKRGKLRKVNDQREELEKKRNKIRKEMGALKVEKMEIEASLKAKEKEYGSEINRNKKAQTVEKYNGVKEEELKNQTLKGYKIKYMQMVSDKEKYVSNLMYQISGMDLGIDEEIKNEMLDKLKGNMMKEIEKMKQGDELTRKTDETEKWLEENKEPMIEVLINLENEIGKKTDEIAQNQISQKDSQVKGVNINEIVNLKQEEYQLRTELLSLQNQYEAIKNELGPKMEDYDGSSVDSVIESAKLKMKENIGNKNLEVENLVPKNEESKSEEELADGLKLLEGYREEWRKRIKFLSEETKEKIIKAANKIPVNVIVDKEGTRTVEFRLGDRIYKILDPNIENHTDDKYRFYRDYPFTETARHNVLLGGMNGSDVNKRDNQKLKEYVKQKETEGFHLPNVDEIKTLLSNLGKQAGLEIKDKNNALEETAMLMYLTGLNGYYWLNHAKSRCNRLDCVDAKHGISQLVYDDSFGRLLMMFSGSARAENLLRELGVSRVEDLSEDAYFYFLRMLSDYNKKSTDSKTGNIEEIEGLNYTEIAKKLIEKGVGIYVAENLDKFQGLNTAEVADMLIEKGYFNQKETENKAGEQEVYFCAPNGTRDIKKVKVGRIEMEKFHPEKTVIKPRLAKK